MPANQQGDSPAPAPSPGAKALAAPRLARQLLGYLGVGGLSAVVDIGLFHLLAPRLPSLLLAAAASFIIAAVVNYSLSSVWVYRRQWRSLRRAAMFLAFASVGLCINAGATWWLAGALPIAPTLAKVGGVGIAFLANFLMNTFIVFRAED
ncbi:MAG: putative rane protein [Polaromonas sp.]|nr:putative rane protein [Polaromonas sp.]